MSAPFLRTRSPLAVQLLARFAGAQYCYRRGVGRGYWGRVHWAVYWRTRHRQEQLAVRIAEEAATLRALFRQEVTA